MGPPRVAASCPDYASLLHLMTQSDLLGVLPHPALLDGALKGQVVPLRLREALPRYEMHLFTPIRQRRALRPVFDMLLQQAARKYRPRGEGVVDTLIHWRGSPGIGVRLRISRDDGIDRAPSHGEGNRGGAQQLTVRLDANGTVGLDPDRRPPVADDSRISGERTEVELR